MQNRKDITRGRINGAAAARDTNSELLRHSPGLLPLGVARKVGLRTGAPPSTPTRGVPSGHLGGERSPILALWLKCILFLLGRPA